MKCYICTALYIYVIKCLGRKVYLKINVNISRYDHNIIFNGPYNLDILYLINFDWFLKRIFNTLTLT